MKVIGIIPARYASTRFFGKLLIPIMGKSLLQRTYENAKAAHLILYIATDSPMIEEHALSFGAKVIRTSSLPKNGTERIAEALEKEASLQKADLIVNIQGDHPCLLPATIKNTVKMLVRFTFAPMATAATKAKKEELLKPQVVKCRMGKNHSAATFSRSYQEGDLAHIGLYVYRRDFLKTFVSLSPTSGQMKEDLEQLKALEHGYDIKVAVVQDYPIGVDVPEDIQKVEKFLCRLNTSL